MVGRRRNDEHSDRTRTLTIPWSRLGFGLVLGVVVVALLLLVADIRRVIPVLVLFDWRLLPLVFLLTVGNYVLRFVKWHWYLRWVGVEGLSRPISAAVFLSGFAMSITPGKVGEWIKAYLVARVGGGSVAPVVPVVAAERLTDGLAMLLLALGSVALGIGWGWEPLVLLLGVVLLVLWTVQEERIALPLIRLAMRIPLLHERGEVLLRVYGATRAILSWRRLMGVIALSIVSWSFECFGLFVILVGLGIEPTPQLVAVATFVLSTASIAGALSLLPGGLGAAEAGIAGLLLALRPDLSAPTAAVATILIRIGTFWFGVILGALSLLWLQRKLMRPTLPHVVAPERTHK